jgi:type II secretory pathway component PulJ
LTPVDRWLWVMLALTLLSIVGLTAWFFLTT